MNKLLFYIVLLISKAISVLLNIFANGRGTNLPGNIAIKICPEFLKYFKLPNTVIAVTGSNGKTSTTNFICDILEKKGYNVINNKEGSNMASGIATTLLKAAPLSGKCNQDMAVFEVDERGSSQIYKYITPNYLVCTNLFRDSIMRNGHSEFVKSKIEEKLPKKTTLILNADDLISGSIGKDNSKIYFGIDKIEGEEQEKNNLAMDILACPKCNGKLEFEYIHYNHIGKAHCRDCNFKSPKANILLKNIDTEKGTFIVQENGQEYQYNSSIKEKFNLYNIIATITLLRQLNIAHEDLIKEIEKIKIKASRKDETEVNGKEIIKMLSKDQNPISCSRAMEYVAKSDKEKVVILIIMNFKGKQDECEDSSWIYDTDFEYLKSDSIKQIIIGGKRALDIALRLRIAGIREEKIKISLETDTIEQNINMDEIKEIYILHSLYAETTAEKLKDNLIKKLEQNYE